MSFEVLLNAQPPVRLRVTLASLDMATTANTAGDFLSRHGEEHQGSGWVALHFCMPSTQRTVTSLLTDPLGLVVTCPCPHALTTGDRATIARVPGDAATHLGVLRRDVHDVPALEHNVVRDVVRVPAY